MALRHHYTIIVPIDQSKLIKLFSIQITPANIFLIISVRIVGQICVVDRVCVVVVVFTTQCSLRRG